MTPKIGFYANPTGGPGIFLTRLKAELERLCCFDEQQPNCWIQLCYEPLPEFLVQNRSIKRIVRTDGVYNVLYHFIRKPWSISLPVIDQWYSQKKNERRNHPIRDNLLQADGIIYQSQFSRKTTHCFVTPTQPGTIILNGVDTTHFSPNPQYRRPERQLNILISHSFRPGKRLHEAMRILAALQKRLSTYAITLHVVGGDDGRSIAYAQTVMNTLNLAPQVKFYGKQPYTHLAEIYRQCDFALGLSYWDACPNVIVEELSCGLPVLGVDSGGIPEIVGEAGRLIPENIPFDYINHYDFKSLPKVDPERYADEALILLERLPEYRTLARERALKELDIRITAQRYIQACESTLVSL